MRWSDDELGSRLGDVRVENLGWKKGGREEKGEGERDEWGIENCAGSFMRGWFKEEAAWDFGRDWK